MAVAENVDRAGSRREEVQQSVRAMQRTDDDGPWTRVGQWPSRKRAAEEVVAAKSVGVVTVAADCARRNG